MSDELDDAPPRPEVIWEGVSDEGNPLRIVVIYSERKGPEDADWQNLRTYVYERGVSRNAMGDWGYERTPFMELPLVFFDDVAEAFRRLGGSARDKWDKSCQRTSNGRKRAGTP